MTKRKKKRLSHWYGNVIKEMLNNESEAGRCIERTRLNIDRAPNESIRSWILRVLKMKRKIKKCPQNYNMRFLMGETNSV